MILFFINNNTEELLVESQLKIRDSDFRYINSSFYYYNSHNNLDSIITSNYYRSLPDLDSIITSNCIKIETFSDYDNAFNPLKHLFLFKETFYRTLSVNNYREYSHVTKVLVK